ncbi:MAG: PhnD/SsuA/transferrin family substrate-binding protein [Alphaproteobacteria bacterium]|nr:PhnD/SsuA/transferrin family substrate-binding protein [Alphaproteobacteria bacterium]
MRIGVLAQRGMEEALRAWVPTARHLGERIPSRSFAVVPLAQSELSDAARSGQVDFVITNAAHLAALGVEAGARPIATLRASDDHEYGSLFGAVVFARSERTDLATFADLRGKRFAAASRDSFGGFHLAWRELARAGIDPDTDFARLGFLGLPQDEVVYAVIAGEYDAGTVRAGLLEQLAAEEKIDLAEIRVVAPRDPPRFPYRLSTPLYPEWAIAALRTTPGALSAEVMLALLAMPRHGPAAQSGGYRGWTVPLDYEPVRELLSALRLGPYAPVTLDDLWHVARRRADWLIWGGLALAVVLGHAVWVEALVRRRTRELVAANEALRREMAERRDAEDAARRHHEALTHVSRVSLMGEMATTIAHELNQPLAAVTSYVQGCLRHLAHGAQGGALREGLEQAARQSQRAAGILESIRGFVRKAPRRVERVDVNAACVAVRDLMAAELRERSVALDLALEQAMPQVLASRIEIEQILVNLVRNAAEAIGEAGASGGRIAIATRVLPGAVEITVSDNGPGIAAGKEEEVFRTFFTTKADGLGLGLAICQSIAEAHGGSIRLERGAEGGAAFSLRLPSVAASDAGLLVAAQ